MIFSCYIKCKLVLYSNEVYGKQFFVHHKNIIFCWMFPHQPRVTPQMIYDNQDKHYNGLAYLICDYVTKPIHAFMRKTNIRFIYYFSYWLHLPEFFNAAQIITIHKYQLPYQSTIDCWDNSLNPSVSQHPRTIDLFMNGVNPGNHQ